MDEELKNNKIIYHMQITEYDKKKLEAYADKLNGIYTIVKHSWRSILDDLIRESLDNFPKY